MIEPCLASVSLQICFARRAWLTREILLSANPPSLIGEKSFDWLVRCILFLPSDIPQKKSSHFESNLVQNVFWNFYIR